VITTAFFQDTSWRMGGDWQIDVNRLALKKKFVAQAF
jgi:hypothetical protein